MKAGTAFTVATGAARAFSRTAVGAGLDIASGALSAVETLVGPAEGKPVLRVAVLILADEHGTPLAREDNLAPALETATSVLDGAGIRMRTTEITTVTRPAPTRALDPRANRGLLLDDLLGHTAFYREHSPAPGLGLIASPVTVVVVRNISGRTTGCSLGVTADWVVVESSLFDPASPSTYDTTVLVHELGHALNLPHHRDRSNLMFPESSPPGGIRQTGLTRWQSALMRSNRHIVPGR